MSNTLCEQCFFAKETNSDKPCLFNIPDIIKDYHQIEKVNNYYKLVSYNCRYGFSKKTYHENIDKFNEINITEYIKQQNIVKYSLVIIAQNNDHSKIIESLNKLSIKPFYITIICYNNGVPLHSKLLEQTPYIPYKVHTFLDKIPAPQALHIALETNKNKVGDLLWILHDSSLESCVDNDSIQNINYIINVEQRPAHYYKNKKLASSFDGIFINTNNYWTLSRTENYTIEHNNQTLIVEYD